MDRAIFHGEQGFVKLNCDSLIFHGEQPIGVGIVVDLGSWNVLL